MPVYAQSDATYATHIPYITVKEYLAEPTGVNVSDLIVGGTPEQQQAALAEKIRQASSACDLYCCQALAATRNVQSGRHRIMRDSTIRISLHCTPIIAVNQIQIGFTPATMRAVADLANVWIDRKVVTIPLPWATSDYSDRVFDLVDYTNGWPCTTGISPLLNGVTQIPVASPLGVVPGMQLSINDGANTEIVTVAAGYQPETNPVLLAAPTTNPHTPAGFAVSALPHGVKEAVVAFTTAFIKTRGNNAMVMAAISGPPSQQAASQPGAIADVERAKKLLTNFVRTA